MLSPTGHTLGLTPGWESLLYTLFRRLENPLGSWVACSSPRTLKNIILVVKAYCKTLA